MKTLPLLFLALTFMVGYSQQPGEQIDFGKYNSSTDVPPIKKNPKNREFRLIDETKKLDLSLCKVHHSRVFKGDTTSMSYQGYFVEFIPKRVEKTKPEFAYTTDYVTNEDWNTFEKYCFDSITRLVLGWESGSDIWMIPQYYENGNLLDKSEWKLNWNTKLERSKLEGETLYTIAYNYFPESERINRLRQIDPRKVQYEYYWLDIRKPSHSAKVDEEALRSHPEFPTYIIKEVSSLYRDSTAWIKDTSLNYFNNIEDGIVTHYNHDPYFKDMPVSGITQPQARGFLHWMEWNHNVKLEELGIPYYVKYELPTIEEVYNPLPVIEIPSFSLDEWQITNKEYKAFVDYVADSIAHKILAFEIDPLIYLKPTLNEFGEEMYEEELPINWKSKINWKRKTGAKGYDGEKPPYGVIADMFYPQYMGADSTLLDKRKLIFEYYFYDHKTASIEPIREEGEKNHCANYYYDCEDKVCMDWGQDIDCFRGEQRFLGKNLDLSYYNSRCEATDVFSHEDRSQFIVQDKITVYPGLNYLQFNKLSDKYCQWGNVYDYENPCNEYDCEMCPQIDDWETAIPEEYDFDSNPDDLMEGITYYQYRAYWIWYMREFRKEVKGNPVIADYIPSREEFEKLQKGKSIEHPKEVHELPSPAFNYTIKFYKKTFN